MDIRDCEAIQAGLSPATGVYVGAQEIWTPGSGPTVLAAAQFAGNAQGLRLDVALGGTGAINYEVQALVNVVGVYTIEDRVFMTQFPAGRQAGLFVSNLFPAVALATGDSQVGSTGGAINGALAPQNVWMLLTFSADGTVAPTGLWRGSMEALDGSIAYSAGGRTKGVEDSLAVERFDLNGGSAENGFATIRFAEVRGYNAQRSDAQRQLDLTNLDPSGAEFWLRFSDDGGGGLAVTDLTGNGYVPELLIGTLAAGPTIGA